MTSGVSAYGTHWHPWSSYDSDGYEHRLQRRDDEPRGHRRFGYRSASRDVPEDFQPDEVEWPDDLPGRSL